MKKTCYLLALTLLSLPSFLFSEQKMRIAVTDFTPNNVSKYAARAVSDNISIEMTNAGDFVMIERSQMKSILAEQGFQQTGCTDSSCAVELGKLLSANKMLIGTLSKLGSVYTLNAKVIDVEKGSIVFAESERCNKEDDIDAASRILAARLINKITGKEYDVPKRTYSFEQERNRFALETTVRLTKDKKIKIPAMDGSNGNIKAINIDSIISNYWDIILAPSYEFSDYFTLKLSGTYTERENRAGDGYYGSTSYTESNIRRSESFSAFTRFKIKGYSLGTNFQFNYPFTGFRPFMTLGFSYRNYTYKKDSDLWQFSYTKSITQDGSRFERRVDYEFTKAEYYSIMSDLSLGTAVNISQYFELLILVVLEVPVYEKYNYAYELTGDSGIRSFYTGDPANDTTTSYLQQDSNPSGSNTLASSFSQVDFYLQAGFAIRIF